MFNKKDDPFDDKVKCEKCFCWLDKNQAIKIIDVNIFGSITYIFYCGTDKPPYDKIVWEVNPKPIHSEDNLPHYFAFKEVDIDGKLIK